MKKMDEMERNLFLRSEEIAYKITLAILCIWTLFNCWQTLSYGARYNPLPGLVVCLAVTVQSFSQMLLQRKMIAGDEEYREPNKFLRAVLGVIAIAAITMFLGTYILIRV